MNRYLITGLKTPIIALVSVLLISLTSRAESRLFGAEIVVKTKEVKGEVWPQVTAQALIKATPLASIAIFAAYDYQKSYIPNLLKSDVTFEEVKGGKNDTHVSYKMDMPWPISDSEYLHGHELTRPDSNSYKVRWYMIKSDSADNVTGYALFAPHPNIPQYTLMTYVSQVTPKSFFAGALKKLMVGDVVKSIEVTRATIERLLKEDPRLVDKYQDKIRLVLAGKKAYLQ